MKKVLVGLLLVVALFAFAAETTFTIGNFSYSGTVRFQLVVDKGGINISGIATDGTNADFVRGRVSFTFGPTSQVGATFSLSYSGISDKGMTFDLKLNDVKFETPFFTGYYTTSPQFVSDYFTGRDAKGNFVAGLKDAFQITLPKTVPGLEFYFQELKDDTTNDAIYFEDMLLVKYTVKPFTLIGGFYNIANKDKYEYGAHANAEFDLGIIKPNVTVFAGMVDEDGKTAYDLIVKGSMTPVKGLTIAPEFKMGENLDKLDYKSSNIENGKYVKATITYTDTFGPVTPTLKITPNYDFSGAQGTFSLKLDEAKVVLKVDPVTLTAKVTNDNVLDEKKKYTLDADVKLVIDKTTVGAFAFWDNVAEIDKYKYINAYVETTIDQLYLRGDYAMFKDKTGDKNGYKIYGKYNLTANTYFDGYYGTLGDPDKNKIYDAAGEFLNAPDWKVRLVYEAKF
ncbi:hypothetical protein [Fervidobacterium thailandense]|uniref:S-layer protein n=1 Tax=Fervidobacterium thailandense TaxID=1008305 RepID=A0A1E3G490_9BACT|nr:hypothetical protein [Fervidobacterium thailandense]ODN31085.1 hypothetical protein A4H02_02090 [Fervidobacterium thailandense]